MAHIDPGSIRSFDDLPPAERRRAIGHAVVCAGCRAALLAEDPSRAFCLLAAAPLPAAALERLSRRVEAGVDELAARPVAGPWRRLAPIAAGIVLALALAILGFRRDDDRGVVSTLPDDTVIETAEIQQLLDERAPIEGVEILSSPGNAAEVLDLAVGDTQIVMIFDEALEL